MNRKIVKQRRKKKESRSKDMGCGRLINREVEGERQNKKNNNGSKKIDKWMMKCLCVKELIIEVDRNNSGE